MSMAWSSVSRHVWARPPRGSRMVEKAAPGNPDPPLAVSDETLDRLAAGTEGRDYSGPRLGFASAWPNPTDTCSPSVQFRSGASQMSQWSPGKLGNSSWM